MRLALIRQMKPLDFTLCEVRTVLEALDTLEAGTDDEREAVLTELLARFADAGEARCKRLRERLAAAEGTVKLLRRATRRRPARAR